MNIKDIAADFQIVGSRIVQMKIKNDFVFFDQMQEMKKKLDLKHSIADVIVNDHHQFQGLLQLHISATTSIGKQKCAVNMQIEGCFLADEAIGEKKFREMLCVNGITALYGLARANMSAISSQMFTHGNIVLPMINVMQYSENITKDKDQEAEEE